MATGLSVLALIAAAVALGYAWKLQQELGQMTRRLDRYNRALFDANDELRKLREELSEGTAALRVELMRATDSLRFAPETTVRQAERIHPQAGQVLAGFHLGGCESCAVEPDATLAQICGERGLPLDSLLANLNTLVDAGNGVPARAPTMVKLPNVSLEIE